MHSIEEAAVSECRSFLREYFLLFIANVWLISTADIVVCCNWWIPHPFFMILLNVVNELVISCVCAASLRSSFWYNLCLLNVSSQYFNIVGRMSVKHLVSKNTSPVMSRRFSEGVHWGTGTWKKGTCGQLPKTRDLFLRSLPYV